MGVNLDVRNAGKMLVIRMQAFAYENIMCGDLPKAGIIADAIMAQYEGHCHRCPTDSRGYWANHYFRRWQDELRHAKIID